MKSVIKDCVSQDFIDVMKRRYQTLYRQLQKYHRGTDAFSFVHGQLHECELVLHSCKIPLGDFARLKKAKLTEEVHFI